MKSGTLNLSAFNNAEIMEIERDDRMETGIFIPIEDNCLYRSKNGKVKCFIDVMESKKNIYGQTHYIRVHASMKKAKPLYEKGFRPPIIGTLGRPVQWNAVIPDNIKELLK